MVLRCGTVVLLILLEAHLNRTVVEKDMTNPVPYATLNFSFDGTGVDLATSGSTPHDKPAFLAAATNFLAELSVRHTFFPERK